MNADSLNLADAELVSISLGAGVACIEIRRWDGKHIDIQFEDVVGLEALSSNGLSRADWRFAESDMLLKILRRLFVEPPRDHGYGTFQLFDTEGEVCLVVIAKRWKQRGDGRD